MKTLEQVAGRIDRPYRDSYVYVDLGKLLDSPVTRALGYVSDVWGNGPQLVLSYIELENGTLVSCDGEHDFAYVYSNEPGANQILSPGSDQLVALCEDEEE